MNIIVKFFHELFNPHCKHCETARELEIEFASELKRCRSCEALERQVAVLNDQNRLLLDRITKPETKPEIESIESVKPLNRTKIPFSIIRQQLEAESRAKKVALENAAKPDSDLKDLEDLVFSKQNG